MVLINGIKYACERCIRGHRVTTCNHTDQPLMMIKPKGRPSTTCSYCKELRKNKCAKPPGTCTCGRQEKKRQQQRAKEEARAKAKELANQSCTCGTEVPCAVHANKRLSSSTSSRKLSGQTSNPVNIQRKNKSRQQKFERAASTASLDSHFFSNQSVASDSSGYFPSSFIDNDSVPGKISKDYHHVPSLASISSLHSSTSLDQNLASPQSPTLVGPSFGFFSDANHAVSNSFTNSGSLVQRAKHHLNNWDTNSSAGPTRSDSHLNLLENNLSVGLDSLNGARKGSAVLPKRSVGEVIVPLEEFIPSDINGVGNVNDADGWDLEDASIKNLSTTATTHTNTNTDYYRSAGNAPSRGSEAPAQMNDEHIKHMASNGLLDMFPDSSSISTLSRANLLLQEKNGQTEESAQPTQSFHQWNNVQGDQHRLQQPAHQQQQPQQSVSEYPQSLNDNDSVQSVEVLSLMPSFMDIPDYEPHHKRKQRPARATSSSEGYNNKRSSSIDRNHKYTKNSPGRTINPMVVSNLDDGSSLHSFQSPESHGVGLENFNMSAIDENIAHDINGKNLTGALNHQAGNGGGIDTNGKLQSPDLKPPSSSPTDLLSDQGFAELDSFLSTL
ncbi:Haa1p KNAG_0D02340 [Huiozyma naganishii CBS 8797]|uniref:Copper-fist domain-containing protein n=1 Tax=Huiozyma naganishii (strain ATCC MYA-139 / BCRC 22969 / CBS 8797 / KCTC 17520 / NBRC 10181 / NCYC 3082 / Yp74L-3) TaxID=1071383 RepID=J7S5S8_HUIN7|nr:hypothetical protein KNAG_0D02340 [Kazachstania naganishii CBS 8797]CCK69984.1 hypothetical protein KNAG_0D02340 [Kazachstania naganishii CBS 8797]